MKITTIGCGNAFSTKNFNQCFLVEENNRKMLIDCGQQIVPFALAKAGIKVSDINDIYISHLHADHIGSLEAFAFLRYDWMGHAEKCSERKNPESAPTLIAKKTIIEKLWEESLRGGLKNSMQWFDAQLESFFHVCSITHPQFDWQGWTCTPVQLVHIMAFGDISPSYGLMMEKKGNKTVFFTTDSQHLTPAQMVDFYDKADLIFQDCETTLYPSKVHAHYKELAGYEGTNSAKLSAKVKSTMWLSHYGDNVSMSLDFDNKTVCNWDERAKKDGFAGFVKVGQTFEI